MSKKGTNCKIDIWQIYTSEKATLAIYLENIPSPIFLEWKIFH
jgi:hypothetical protein